MFTLLARVFLLMLGTGLFVLGLLDARFKHAEHAGGAILVASWIVFDPDVRAWWFRKSVKHLSYWVYNELNYSTELRLYWRRHPLAIVYSDASWSILCTNGRIIDTGRSGRADKSLSYNLEQARTVSKAWYANYPAPR